ncbi:MAG: hypothetical protein HYW88_02530 [Candidatus Sungbacteria bacterium]|nr:hypothetical protein [Candidatus Sungbacteria bacterium]
MKRIFVFLAALLIIPAIALGITLPDYQKDGKVTETWICDHGQTTTRTYADKDEMWAAYEITASSGDILVYLQSVNGQGFFMKRAGSSEMAESTFEEFDPLFKKLAPETHKSFTGRSNDCVQKD